MKKYLIYIITILTISILIIASIFCFIVLYPQGVFYSSYQSMIADKYRLLQNTNEPKIIIVGGSASAFGIDQKMIEDETGYKVVNLGLHGGFAPLFYTELSKENLNPGDIVLLTYEYGWENDFDHIGQDLVMSGIDDNIDMYIHIPPKYWGDIIGYLFKYAAKKHEFEGASGVYSRESFDPISTQLIIHREYCMDYENNKEKLGTINLSGVSISDTSREYLTQYKDYVNKKGAKIYFTAPPVLKDAVINDPVELDILKEQEETLIGIPYISDPKKYLFPKELMYDTIYHCNSEGEKHRTRLLIDDLNAVIDP